MTTAGEEAFAVRFLNVTDADGHKLGDLVGFGSSVDAAWQDVTQNRELSYDDWQAV